MFVRKKPNKSGIISVQIVDKSSGKYKMVKTIGSSAEGDEIDRLVAKGEQWIKDRLGVVEIDFSNTRQFTAEIIDHIEQINIAGTELLLGNIFNQIGFGQIPDSMFRRLVLARLCNPVSKLKTRDYLIRHHSYFIEVQQIYRYLDKLYKKHKETVQQISYDHTLSVLQGEINIVFYDVTTLYFEIDHEDELRKAGYSKDGKHQHPQIVLGLLVSVDGYPLAYEIFEGNKFEGHTMLPVIDAFKTKHKLEKLVVIADSGLLSSENIRQLKGKGYEFILGARIKSESRQVKEQILRTRLNNGESSIINKDDNTRLIITYSDSRAGKDRANREKGLRKLEKQVSTGKLTKASINNKGYNKYLKLEGEISITIDRDKYEDDLKWDGLKGYLTNTQLSKDEIISNYGHLWKIEKAFRISKNELKIRPIYHRIQRRIEAHLCIAFVAYKIYKELERQLKIMDMAISPEKAIEIAETIYAIRVKISGEIITKTLLLTEEQKYLAKMFDF